MTRVRTVLPLLTVAAAALITVSCGDDTPEPPDGSASSGAFDPPMLACTPGEALGCLCIDGRAGTQLCAPNGHELGGCECDGGGSTPDDTTGGDGDTEGDTEGDTDDGPTGAGGLCGNGVIDDDEQCDDGNTRYDDACNNSCISECGLTWEVAIGEPDDGSFGLAAAVSPDNSIVVLGSVETDRGAQLWLGRYDAEGTELSSVPLADGLGVEPGAVAVDGDGNVLVVGTVGAPGTRDIWVRLYDDAGALTWSDTHDGTDSGDDAGVGATFDADGNAIVTGTVRDADADTDLWVRKYDTSGQPMWTETYGGPGNGTFSLDTGGAVTTDADGNIFAQLEVYVNFDERDVHLVKFAPGGGAPQWDVAPFAGGDSDEHSWAGVANDANGNVVMGFNNGAVTSGWRFWVMKFDTDGNEIWQADTDTTELGLRHRLNALGVSDSGDIGLVLTLDQERGDWAAVNATLREDGTIACSSTTSVPLGAIIPAGGVVGSAGQIYATGFVSENGMSQQRWLARFRGAAAQR